VTRRSDPSASAAIGEIPFLGVQVSRLDMPAAARVIAERPLGAPFAYVVTPNAQHFVMLDKAQDKAFGAAYADAWLRLCDSKVVSALAPVLMGEQVPHAAGSDLTAYLFRRYIQPDDPITVIGGEDELAARLRAQFELTHLNHHNPPMGFTRSPEAVERCVEFVHDHPARYVFLAVGARRRKFWRIGSRPGRAPSAPACASGARCGSWWASRSAHPSCIGRWAWNGCTG